MFRPCFSANGIQWRRQRQGEKYGDTPHVAVDEGESHHSRDDSVEYVGTIRKGLRGILPSLLDQVLLGILGAKIQPSFVKWIPISSSSSFEIWLDSQLPSELRSDGTAFYL